MPKLKKKSVDQRAREARERSRKHADRANSNRKRADGANPNPKRDDRAAAMRIRRQDPVYAARERAKAAAEMRVRRQDPVYAARERARNASRIRAVRAKIARANANPHQTFGTKTSASRLAVTTDIQCKQPRPRKDNLERVNQPPEKWAHVKIFTPESLDFSVDTPTGDPLALPTLPSSVNDTPSPDAPIMMLSNRSKRTSSHLQKNPGNSNKVVLEKNFKTLQPGSSSASGLTGQTQNSNDLNLKVIKPVKKLTHRMNSLEDLLKSKVSLYVCGDTFPKTFLLQEHVKIAHDDNADS